MVSLKIATSREQTLRLVKLIKLKSNRNRKKDGAGLKKRTL